MPKAILSVHDKTGLVSFAARPGRVGLEAGCFRRHGRASARRRAAGHRGERDYTGSPEILGGRVKTLHPAIHGGLLARATPDDHDELHGLGWDYIDLVAVNLYPFEADHRQAGRHAGGRDREYRYRRGDVDPRGSQEFRARDAGVRPGRLRRHSE